MQWFARLTSLVRNLVRRTAIESDLDAELNSYIEEQAQKKVAEGLAYSEALHQARIEAGGVQQVREEVRAARTGAWLQTFWQDVRYGARMLRHHPGFTLACILTFAIGIGANTAIFSMVNALVLRPLPAHNPHRLTYFVAKLGASWGNGFSVPDFIDVHNQAGEAFADIAGVQQLQREGLSFRRNSQTIWVDYVSTNFFSLMGVKPALGNFFSQDPDLKGKDPALVLGYSFWKTHFSGDRGVVGQTVLINGQAVTIVGVAQEGFQGAAGLIDMQGFLPLGIADRLQSESNIGKLDDRDRQRLLLVGRLNDGVGLAKANSVLAVIAHRLAAQYPSSHQGLSIRAVPLGIGFTNSTGENPLPLVSALFLTLAGMVLLLAGANVTNLLLVRAAARNREMAVRSALGAARLRLMRQVLTETVLLAFLGCLAGILVGAIASRMLSAIPPLGDLPIVINFSPDWRVFTYAFAAAFAVSLIGGILPAWRASGVDLNDVLREGGRQSSSRRQRLRSALVVAQVAGSLTLLIVAGLFVRSLNNVQRRDLGFDPRGVMTFSLDPHGAGYDEVRGREFYEQLSQRVRALPGVESASLAQSVPVGTSGVGAELEIDGVKQQPGKRPEAGYDSVSPEFLQTLRIGFVRGREFSEMDTETTPRVAIINEVMAHRLWPGKDPIGHQFKRLDDPEHTIQVVGIMKDAQTEDLMSPIGCYFLMPIAQNHVSRQILIVKSSVSTVAIVQPVLQTIRQLNPDIPIYDVVSMDQLVNGINGLYLFRLGAGLASALGLLGLTLAVIGVFGVISFSAAQRTREIGIRMALGAQPGQVIGIIFRQGVVIVGTGVMIGILAAGAIAKLVGSFLVNVSAFDPLTYLAVGSLLAAIALLASFLPARRATRVDPAMVLRQE
jgi:predicted permease